MRADARLAVAAAMGLIVGVSVLALPTDPRNRSEFGYWLKGHAPRRAAVSPRMACLRQTATGHWEAALFGQLDERGWSLEGPEATGIYLAVLRPDVQRHGLLWPTQERDLTRIEAWPVSGRRRLVAVPPEARRAFVDAFFSDPGPRWEALAVADFDESAPWVPGYMLNAITLTCLVGAPVLFPWAAARRAINDLPQLFASRRPWQCRMCGYDLRGLAHRRCPECGEQSAAS